MAVSVKDKWAACLCQIRTSLAEHDFNVWFAPLQFVEFKDGVLAIGVKNEFVPQYIEEHYSNELRDALLAHFGTGISLKYKVLVAQPAPTAPTVPPAVAKPAVPAFDSNLNRTYDFAQFVEGESNKLARTVGLSIAEKPGQQTFNPFFLYGPSGVGKTHLVNAIGLKIKENFPEKRVLFLPAATFRTQFVDATLKNKTNDFIAFYQTIDVLIVDDIQEMSTERTQQTFFHIFNHLQQNGRQIIITCDRAPALIEGFEERMLTRFKWGMTAELNRPDIRLRMEILKAKLFRDGLVLAPNVIRYIAEKVSSSVRELEGVINSIMAYSITDNCEMDERLAEIVIARTISLNADELTLEHIVQSVCSHTGVKKKDLFSKSRKQDITQARQLAMYLCKKHLDLPYSQIGRQIGRRDHSTVLHACNQVSLRLSVEKNYRREVEALEAALKQ